MKLGSYVVSVVVLALLLSTVAFARSKNKDKGTLDLAETAQVGSTQLQPGHYKVEWNEEAGNKVGINILRHGKTVATANGTVKDMKEASPYDSVTTKAISNNKKEIVEIDFSGRKDALVLGS
jgi:hypothetical protein